MFRIYFHQEMIKKLFFQFFLIILNINILSSCLPSNYGKVENTFTSGWKPVSSIVAGMSSSESIVTSLKDIPVIITFPSEVQNISIDSFDITNGQILRITEGANGTSARNLTSKKNSTKAVNVSKVSKVSKVSNASKVYTLWIRPINEGEIIIKLKSQTIFDYVNKTNIETSYSIVYITSDSILKNSTLTVSPASIGVNQTSTITLTIKVLDNNISGETVTFSRSTGVGESVGTISATTNVGNGVYSATYTATAKGTANTIYATISNGETVTDTKTITVINSDPAIASSNYLFPIDGNYPPLVQGTPVTLATTSDNDSVDSAVFTACTYQTVGLSSSDPSYAAPSSSCNPAPTLGTSSLSWTPLYTHKGTFQFNLTASDGNSTVNKTVYASVRPNYTTDKLLSIIDATFASYEVATLATVASVPYASGDSSHGWYNLLSTGSNAAFDGSFSNNHWTGTGAVGTPYALTFDKTSAHDQLDLGNSLSGKSKFAASAWIKPALAGTPSMVIVGNGGGTSQSGFAIRQSTYPPGRAELVVGKKYYSYQNLILAHKPAGYWRLNEAAGVVANDLTSYQNHGTHTAGVTLNQAGIPADASSKSALYTGALSGQTDLTSTIQFDSGNFSLEGWFKTSADTTGVYQQIWNSGYNGVLTDDLEIRFLDNKINAYIRDDVNASVSLSSTGTVNDGIWHYWALTRNGNVFSLYIDNLAPVTSTTVLADVDAAGVVPRIGNGLDGIGDSYATSQFADFAIYTYALSATQISQHYQTGNAGNYVSYPGNAILADQPAGYWRLNENFGAITYDYSENNNHATYTGTYTLNQSGPFVNSGDQSNAVKLDGSTAYVNIPNSNKYYFRKYTLEAWINISSVSPINLTPIVSQWGLGGAGESSWGMWVGIDRKINISAYDGANSSYMAGTQAVALNTWHHVVGVYIGGTAGTNAFIYIDGSLDKSGTLNKSPQDSTNYFVGIGRTTANYSADQYLNGTVADVALYNYPLSPTQITNHYNSGNGAGWWTCQSKSIIDNYWYNLSSIFDGTNAKLFVNGQQECSVQPTTVGASAYSSTANTYVGADPSLSASSLWSGNIGDIKLFGTSDGSASASSTTIQNDYYISTNRFQNIVTSNLVLHYDASTAKNGVAPPTNGCADTLWTDLSSSNLNGTLTNFIGACGAGSGWVGDGSSSNPYVLKFDGTNDYVNLGTITTTTDFSTANGITMEVWAYPTSSGLWTRFFDLSNGTSSDNIVFGRETTTDKLGFAVFRGAAFPGDNFSNAGVIVNSTWQHFVVTANPLNATQSTVTFYKNGTSVGSSVSNRPMNVTRIQNYIGKSAWGGDAYYQGSIAVARIYTRVLSQSEIRQNCYVQQSRFAINTCAYP
ncbi:MAG: hypothetical protein HQK51_09210 [Oligoflexia bacterium]|nr:hypothetical protein [Oligoflexia bacterium]